MITNNLSNFISTLISLVPFDVSELQLDHFAYQTSSMKDYDNLKKESLEIGVLVSENIVGGRRVGIFKFEKPIQSNGYEILGFELIEPKEGQVCKSELDHIEFVIPVSFDEYLHLHQDVDWNLSAKDRDEFPKLSLKFEDGKSVKFHTKDIFSEIPD